MQGDGTSSGMIETSQTRPGVVLGAQLGCALARHARGRRPSLWCARYSAAAPASKFQKGYILPAGALEQIPMGREPGSGAGGRTARGQIEYA